MINKSGSNFSSDKEGYGPCKNSLCGCSCSSKTCTCLSSSVWVEGSGTGFAASARKSGLKVTGQASTSMFSHRDSEGEARFLSGTASGEVGLTNIKGKFGADLCSVKSDGVQARVGVNIDTGISLDKGVEIKAAGFGVSVGEKWGISTPVGEVAVDKDKCIVQ